MKQNYAKNQEKMRKTIASLAEKIRKLEDMEHRITEIKKDKKVNSLFKNSNLLKRLNEIEEKYIKLTKLIQENLEKIQENFAYLEAKIMTNAKPSEDVVIITNHET